MSEKTDADQKPWLFKKGESGNPQGRPRGSLNRTTRLVQNLLVEDAAEIARVVIDAAKNGDLAAAKLILERIAPPLKENHIEPGVLDFTERLTPQNADVVLSEVFHAVADGRLAPGQGAALAGLVKQVGQSTPSDTPSVNGPRAELPASILEMIEANKKRVYDEMLERKKGNHQSEN